VLVSSANPDWGSGRGDGANPLGKASPQGPPRAATHSIYATSQGNPWRVDAIFAVMIEAKGGVLQLYMSNPRLDR